MCEMCENMERLAELRGIGDEGRITQGAVFIPRQAAVALIAGHLREHDRYVLTLLPNEAAALMGGFLVHEVEGDAYLDKGAETIAQVRGAGGPALACMMACIAKRDLDVTMAVVMILPRDPAIMNSLLAGVGGIENREFDGNRDILAFTQGEAVWGAPDILLRAMDIAGDEYAEAAKELRSNAAVWTPGDDWTPGDEWPPGAPPQ